MSSKSNSSDARLHHLLADYFQKLDRGEVVDKSEYMRAHPDFAAELLDYFALEAEFGVRKGSGAGDGNTQPGQDHPDVVKTDATIAHSQGQPTPDTAAVTNIEATVDHTPGRSRGLHIRCPHCSNGVELLADTPFEEITCKSCGSTFNLAVREDHTSIATALQKVGRFELVSRLGLGGFGTVWKARDTELDRVVAVKIPRKGQLSSLELEQFFREARSAAQLRHPNIVPVYEVGKEQDTIFIVCAFVRGVSLADWLTGHKPDHREICSITQTVARALHHAHEHGVIHRDLKPSNIMLDQANVPHLMDFGLAKRDVNEITMTVEGQILGTPAYMSPEQAMGHAHWTDRRTDIYSLGVMFFEMLTGEKPFRGNAQMQVHQRLTEDAPDPRSLNRHVPRDLSTICLKCLERDPNRRFSNCEQIAGEFDRFLNGVPILSRPISRTERLTRWCKRKPALAAAMALTAILAVGGPAAALRIESQRERLAGLVTEKDDLITQMSAEKEQSVNQLSEVTEELKLLKGQADPWQIWPLERDKGPKHQLLREVYKTHFQPTVERLASAGLGMLDQAYAHLGLAILAEQVEALDQAKEHYSIARDLFNTLSPTSSTEPHIMLPLAECHMGLSRLYDAAEKVKAEEALRAAHDIYERFGGAEPKNLSLKADELDAEMRRAVYAGSPAAQKNLAESVSLIRNVVQNWPTDPREFYSAISQVIGQGASEYVPSQPQQTSTDNR